MKNGNCSFECGCWGKKGFVLKLCCGVEDYNIVSRLANRRPRQSRIEQALHDMIAEFRNFLVEH
jgi:hypothetical protein